MKVTVTFGDTSVVVPCKAGWTVRDLSEQATRRYRRILEQRGEIPMETHHLEYAEGGILDMDDLLSDLVDDRDKLVAVFHKAQYGRTESPRESMSNGSSSAAPSPEPFTYYPHLQYQDENGGEIEVNEAVLKGNTPLMVRSSSDSALAPPTETTPPPDNQSNGTPEPEISNVLKGDLDRLAEDPPAKMSKVNFSSLVRTVAFPGDRGPLGIHVVPYCSSLNGRPLGLHIRGIEENSRSKKEDLFREDECIVQINETPLQDKTFAQSQEVFRQAMGSSLVRVEVLPAANKSRYEKSFIGQLFTSDSKDSSAKASPVVARTKADPQPEPKPEPKKNARIDVRRPDVHSKPPEPTVPNPQPVELQPVHGTLERASPTSIAKGGSSSPTPWTRSESPLASKSPAAPSLANLTNRKGGKKLKIDLKKGSEGLGFTVVTRDSSVQGPGPILVKSILQRGAAVKDGRLQPGDRILEVNGVDMTGRSQEELVAMLRSTKQGESVSMVVARQEDIFLLKSEGTGVRVMEDGREQLMYEIPLNETGSAGLGVSLKGNKSRETGEDLGIFIKSIIHGGAAYKDGRLCINDQMIAVNGESLLGRSNHTAMETLRRSMSSEGNARGTIQVVVLRAPRQMGNAKSTPAANLSANHQPNIQTSSSNQDPRNHDSYQRPSGPSRATTAESTTNGASHTPAMANNYTYSKSGSAPSPAAATSDSHGHYSNNDEEQDFPPPPSPNTVEQMNRDLSLTSPSHSELQKVSRAARAFYAENAQDNVPRNRASKSMDMVADESNVGSLVGQKNKPSEGGALGPTLGLMKSSSLESLQTAMSEVKQSHIQAQVPFHRPRPHMVRGRGCNQSFRIAIDKSYDGPSEDDDDLSDHSSGHETLASSSSRQDLNADDGKKNKKDRKQKKEKKNKGGKKSENSAEDTEKKTKKKGFGLLRFGKKKDDKSKDAAAAKASKSKLEALSEEELDRIPDDRDGYDPRYAEVQSGHGTPDPSSLPDVEDDDMDPNYARIDNFRQPPSPQSFVTRTPSPLVPAGGTSLQQASFEDLDGLYAKVNKSRAPPASQNQHQTQAESDQRLHGLRREYMQARAAPGYEELDAARRRILEYDPNRMAPRGAESRPNHQYEEIDRQNLTQPRRDPYDYPTHSRPMPRDSGPNHYHDAPGAGHSGRLPDPQSGTQSQQTLSNPRYYPSSQTGQQYRAASRQDIPPSPTMGHRGRQYYDSGGRRDGYRQASPGRYISPDKYPADRERYNSPDRYGDERQRDPRRKNPAIGAV